MRVLDPGHDYELLSLDGGAPQRLTFVKRDSPPEKYPGNVGHHPGTHAQEVMRALIDRMQYVNAQVPCAETEAVIALLRECIFLLEARAKRRRGELLELASAVGIEALAPCDRCGHVRCSGHASEGARADS